MHKMYKKLWVILLGILIAIALPIVAITLPAVATTETVIAKAARTGIITMGGRTDIIPYSYVNDKNELVGYSMDVAGLIEQEVSSYLGKPVKVQFQAVNTLPDIISKTASGEIDLACNTQFTWEREMFVDFSVPYSLSGIRLLTKKGGLSGTPESLVGKRVAVLSHSLGESAIKILQPQAIIVTVAGVDEGIAALKSGKVDAVAGDSIVLAGNVQRVSATDYELVPANPYIRYAMGCMMPENNSAFKNLVDMAIAKMAMGYLVGDAKYTALVNKWMGPRGIVELPTELIKDYFQMVLLTHEQIPIAEAPTPTPSNR